MKQLRGEGSELRIRAWNGVGAEICNEYTIARE